MHHHVICPYCENTVLIPYNLTSNIFKHGVFVEESSHFSNRVYQLQVSLDENNQSITVYDTNFKLEEEEFMDGIKDQLADKFYHLEGCNQYFKVLLDDYGQEDESIMTAVMESGVPVSRHIGEYNGFTFDRLNGESVTLIGREGVICNL